MFQTLSCLPYVFGSVQSLLTCFREKLSYSLCGLCLSLSSLILDSYSDSKAFHFFIAFSGSPTAVHHAFLFFDAKAWPQSQADRQAQGNYCNPSRAYAPRVKNSQLVYGRGSFTSGSKHYYTSPTSPPYLAKQLTALFHTRPLFSCFGYCCVVPTIYCVF